MVEVADHGRVRSLTLNRPEKRNALNAGLCRELSRNIDLADGDASVGAILMAANGPAFCAGMDLKEVTEVDSGDLAALHEQLFTSINRVSKPIVAAVRGAALAGGTGLVANAHIVIAAGDASFGLTEIRLGLWPVLVFRAVSLAIGERRTTELSLTGRTFQARDALEYGLVTEISPEPLERAMTVAQSIAVHSPVAVGSGLRYAREIRGANWRESGLLGREMRDRLLRSDEFLAAVAAFGKKKLE